MKENKVAVLIPCKNEAGTIDMVIRNIQKVAPEYEIYVCDNASDDRTGDVALDTGVIVIYEPKIGKGNAMTALFTVANADCYIMCDGDDTYDTDNIREMTDMIFQGYDFVTGNRLQNGYYDTKTAESHKLGNKFINYAVRVLFGKGVDDILSGYRAMSKNFVQSMPKLSSGFTIETEMSIYALAGKFKTANIPVHVKDRTYGKSKIKLTDGIKIIYTLLKSKILNMVGKFPTTIIKE